MTKLVNHDEEEHTEVQEAAQKTARRTAKKRRRMQISGRSVFVLHTLVQRRPTRRRPRQRKQ